MNTTSKITVSPALLLAAVGMVADYRDYLTEEEINGELPAGYSVYNFFDDGVWIVDESKSDCVMAAAVKIQKIDVSFSRSVIADCSGFQVVNYQYNEPMLTLVCGWIESPYSVRSYTGINASYDATAEALRGLAEKISETRA